MKKLSLFILVMLIGCFLFGEKIADLEEVLTISDIRVSNDRIFIASKFNIHIYALKDLKYLGQFGKKGAGPGEFNLQILIEVLPGQLVVNSLGKLLLFSHNGKLIKEFKTNKPPGTCFMPLGEKFIGNRSGQHQQEFSIYDDEFNSIKSIYKGGLGQIVQFEGGTSKKQEWLMVEDYVGVSVYKNKIYVGDTGKGFFLSVFDNAGKGLYEINRKYEKIKITETDKKKGLAKLKEYPGWDKFKNNFNFIFPEFFPTFSSVRIVDDKIYFVSASKVEKKDKVIITDLKGGLLKEAFIPAGFYDREYVFSIYCDKLYYLIENDTEETVELHSVPLK